MPADIPSTRRLEKGAALQVKSTPAIYVSLYLKEAVNTAICSLENYSITYIVVKEYIVLEYSNECFFETVP